MWRNVVAANETANGLVVERRQLIVISLINIGHRGLSMAAGRGRNLYWPVGWQLSNIG